MIKSFMHQRSVWLFLMLNFAFIILQSFFIPPELSADMYTGYLLSGYYSYTFFLFTMPIIIILQSMISSMLNKSYIYIRKGMAWVDCMHVLLSVIAAVAVLIMNVLLSMSIAVIRVQTIVLSDYIYYGNRTILFGIVFTLLGQFVYLLFKEFNMSILVVIAAAIIIQVSNFAIIDTVYGSVINNPHFIKIILLVMMMSLIGCVAVILSRIREDSYGK